MALRSSLQKLAPNIVATGTAGNRALHTTTRAVMRTARDVTWSILRHKPQLFVHTKHNAHDPAKRTPALCAPRSPREDVNVVVEAVGVVAVVAVVNVVVEVNVAVQVVAVVRADVVLVNVKANAVVMVEVDDLCHTMRKAKEKSDPQEHDP